MTFPIMRRTLQTILAGTLAMLLLTGPGSLPGVEQKEAKFILAWGKKGDKPGEFYSPISIAIDRRDVIYVTDLNNARLQQFTTGGEYLGGFDLPLDAPPRKSCIVGGMAVDDDGNAYLSLMNQDKVQVYTESGRVLREWGKRGTADGEFRQPGGIVLAPGGTVYLADQGNHRLQMFDTKGKFRGKWGEHGSGLGQFGGNETRGSRFGGPHFLARDSIGRIYTTEGTLGRVQQFSAEGKPLRAWGDKGSQPGGFGALKTGFSKSTFGPIGVFVDRRDRVWVSSLNDRVQAFTTDGKFLFGLGGTGKNPGQFARPHGMAVDSKGHLYVADAGNQRVQKFEIPDP
jgi:sugar lactone lactonase YvrE